MRSSPRHPSPNPDPDPNPNSNPNPNPNPTLTLTRRDDEHDAYIVVSFVNATLVLSIGETVEEVTDSGLKPDTPTLHTSLLGEDAIVQAEM